MKTQCNCDKCQAWKARATVEGNTQDAAPGSHGWMRPHMPEYGGGKDSKAMPTGLYLGCFHGRAKAEDEMDDWGAQGPMIGPLQYVHCTYMCDVRFAFVSRAAAKKYFEDKGPNSEEGNFEVSEGLLNVGDGMLYGDWTVFYHTQGRKDAA